jgi:DNA-binding NarL/FixJ family response regulator
MPQLRILVVDDHAMVRRGVRSLIELHPEWTVCSEAASGEEAVAKAKTLRPDIAILDFALPGLDGLHAAVQIRKTCPGTEILMFSVHYSDQLIEGVVEAGIRAYVLKSDAAHDLELAIHALANQKSFFAGRVRRAVSRFMARRDGAKATDGGSLTPREREVLVLVAEGNLNATIAGQLGIVRKTVEAHRASLMRKLGLSGVPDLVRYAVRNRIIEA